VIGTPAYMSPEQAGGLSVDGRSDVYSLGAITYEIFCGEPVFRAKTFVENVSKHLNEAPVPPSKTPGGRGIDPQVEALILRCLDKSPDARFLSMRALQMELRSVLGVYETGTRANATPGSFSASSTGQGRRYTGS